MGDNSDRVGTYLVAGLILGALIMAIGHGLPNWDWSADRWFGTKPIADYVTGVLTPLAAGFAAIVALRTFRMNLQSGYSARFQNGVEMLTGGTQTAHTAGLEIMLEVSRLDPKSYFTSVMRTLTIHITDLGVEGWQSIHDKKWVPKGQAPTITAYRTINYLCTISNTGRGAGFGRDKLVYLYRPYLHLVTFSESRRFSLFSFKGLAVGRVDFENTNFENCDFTNINVGGRLTFTNCTFEKVKFSRIGSKKVNFKGGTYRDATFGGKPLTADGSY